MSAGGEQRPWPFERRIARCFRNRMSVFTAVMFTMIGLSLAAGIVLMLAPGSPSGRVTTYGHWGMGGQYFPGHSTDYGESRDPPEVEARRTRFGMLVAFTWFGSVAATGFFALYANQCITREKKRASRGPGA